jgi:hypothetical protein
MDRWTSLNNQRSMPGFLRPAAYRFDWPRANFFTLRFFDPRA